MGVSASSTWGEWMRRALDRTGSRWIAAAIGTAALLLDSAECHAQSAGTNTAKGIAAGALIGAEAVLVTEAALGVRPGWAYWVGGVAGAGAGAAGGYFIGDGASTEATSFLLAGGIALVMPTMIAVVAATTFRPPENNRVEVPLDSEPEPLEEDTAPLSEDEPASARLSLPSVMITRAFSAEEISTYRVTQALGLHIAFAGAF